MGVTERVCCGCESFHFRFLDLEKCLHRRFWLNKKNLRFENFSSKFSKSAVWSVGDVKLGGRQLTNPVRRYQKKKVEKILMFGWFGGVADSAGALGGPILGAFPAGFRGPFLG